MFRVSPDREDPILSPYRSHTPGSVPVREAKFRSRFTEIPRYESLLKYIPCIWRKEAGRNLRGGLYLSENHIAFYCASKTAKATEEQRKLLIEMVSVIQVTKERSLSIFPDSIGIETITGEKYVFGQLFARNTVYKSLCDLCGILPSSRRSSIDPFAGGDAGCFEDAYDDMDSAVTIYNQHPGRSDSNSSKDHSTSSHSSSGTDVRTDVCTHVRSDGRTYDTAMVAPPDLKRTLSVVREVSHDETESQLHDEQGQFLSASPGHQRTHSRRDRDRVQFSQQQPVDGDDEVPSFDRHLITILRLIVGILLATAGVSLYKIYTNDRSVNIRNASASVEQSLGDFRLASDTVIQVAEQARIFLTSFTPPTK